jgi:regulation of enolase protein 1 (concanavalin A-like superfamily)
MVGITPKNGVFAQRREKTGARTKDAEGDKGASTPYWVKLVRRGDNFTGYISANGKKWKEVEEARSIPMSEDVYIGFAVCSQNKKKLCKTVFSNYRVKGKSAN